MGPAQSATHCVANPVIGDLPLAISLGKNKVELTEVLEVHNGKTTAEIIGQPAGEALKKVYPVSRTVLPGLLLFHDQPPDVPVGFDHCMVDSPESSRPGIPDDMPESIVQAVRDSRIGCHRFNSSGHLVDRIAMIYPEAGGGKVKISRETIWYYGYFQQISAG